MMKTSAMATARTFQKSNDTPIHKKPRALRLWSKRRVPRLENTTTGEVQITPDFCGLLASPGVIQVAEELAVGLNQQDIPVAVKGLLVGPHAAGEAVKLRVAVEGFSVNARRGGIALTAHSVGDFSRLRSFLSAFAV